MIARGDLAVECGYQRLAEIQEEILWICEAAHVPAIWATQVLESLAGASGKEAFDAAPASPRRVLLQRLNKPQANRIVLPFCKNIVILSEARNLSSIETQKDSSLRSE
jgi:hypothetical protein